VNARDEDATGLARPFLKWAGGKGDLLSQLEGFFPAGLADGSILRYVEPFVGGGAVFFHVAQGYPLVDLCIADINRELVLIYRAIQRDVDALAGTVGELESRYLALDEPVRKEFYYAMRDRLNAQLASFDYERYGPEWVGRAATLIFLNRTCYNGLFRVNGKGEFNVPFGRYRRPKICDEENLRAVSAVLQRTRIDTGDFALLQPLVDHRTFVYFDPPYRPISTTASFTSYSRHSFDDAEQLRLANFYRMLDKTGAKLMLSNSDPKNLDPDDDFIERAYRGFHIRRVAARRRINRNAEDRGPITEVLITNY
jgi:DNA adenine methylase